MTIHPKEFSRGPQLDCNSKFICIYGLRTSANEILGLTERAKLFSVKHKQQIQDKSLYV